MRVLLLSAPGSSHTQKWAKSLAEQGIEICIFGLSACDQSIYQNYPGIQVRTLNFNNSIIRANIGSFSKLRYLSALSDLKKTITQFKPDILHAHFATSYGLLGSLGNFHPFVLYVWGSDIYEFPRKSSLHRSLIKFNLKQADKILSTSRAMAVEIWKYTSKNVDVTPFGVNLEIFRPRQVESLFDKDDIVVGTVKALEKIYGIEYLIMAFKVLRENQPNLPLKLLLVGSGSQGGYLKRLVSNLNLERVTVFTGRVEHDQVPIYHNMLTIFVALSESESFGVAVIEASASEKPVVVSDVGGLPEVVEHGVTGFIVPARNPERAAEALEKLILNEALRQRMGQAGRDRVKRLYDWSVNVEQMLNIYTNTISQTSVI